MPRKPSARLAAAIHAKTITIGVGMVGPTIHQRQIHPDSTELEGNDTVKRDTHGGSEKLVADADLSS